ncbi:protein PFC0760c-like [Malaya genurostris]|uniref:protein PFC0760c-like n=1 Tax=Malaya genurostris TaxID=325434 RepID=UPI0026F38D34|nr:protein PFC0760c-like [Malaya genurostris]
MRSSIGVTKILTYYFILLYLFLRVKMCVGSVRASSGVSNSDINYYDGDESLQSIPAVASAQSNPTGFVNYSAKKNHHQHAVATTTAHVRHEHHYMKNRHITQAERALRAYKSKFKTVDYRVDKHRHTIHHQPHRRHDLSAHHPSRKSSKHNYDKSWHNFNPSGSSSHPVSQVGTSKTAKYERNSGDSNQQKVDSDKRATGQNRSLSSFTVPSVVKDNVSIKHKSSMKTHKKDNFKQNSKNYFENLLNRYKHYSTFKEYHQLDKSKMTKSLKNTERNCNGERCIKGETKEELDDYEYDDDVDDDDDEGDDDEEDEEDDEEEEETDEQNDYDNTETQGDAGYSTTTSRSVYEAVSSKIYKQSHERNKNDNSIRRDVLRAISDRDDPQPVTQGKKVQTEFQRTDPSRLASHHAIKIRREGSCSVPKPKIILASNDPTKQYTPHCTILHRCGDDVGCCLPTQTCAASKNSTIELYFFVQAVGSRSSIERLSFVNHTECSCINRHETFISTLVPPTSTTTPIITASVCTCPSLFQRVIDNDNRCYCDCSSSDAQCDQFKRGLEHFSMENRRCIKDGRCEEPVCEYGHYNKAKGKCPTREDKLSYSYKG